VGTAWGIALIGMFAVLLVVFALRLRRPDGRPEGRLIAIGVLVGLLVAGLALLLQGTT
jgi:CHASE2 domain-containing sensor protein